jgi:hypothetical protein
MVVSLYTDINYERTCQGFSLSNPDLHHSWVGNDTVSSIRVGVPCPCTSRRIACFSARRTWATVPGLAKDIGIGADGSVWIIGADPVGASDFGIHRWTGRGWESVDGGAVRIDVDDQGIPWVVNSKGEIFRRIGTQWQTLPGRAKDIGIGADGSVWIIGADPVDVSDFGIQRWTGTDWEAVDGATGIRIDVDRDGNPWVVNSKGEIFRRTGTQWQTLPGRAKDIGIGADGSVWVIGTTPVGASNFRTYRWTGSGWEMVDGKGVQISVDNNGVPWVATASGDIFRRP